MHRISVRAPFVLLLTGGGGLEVLRCMLGASHIVTVVPRGVFKELVLVTLGHCEEHPASLLSDYDS